VRIEQQYGQVEGRWFPQELNYVFHLLQNQRKEGIGVTMKGNSRIDSVSFTEQKGFRFDKVHTVKLQPAADHLSDEAWSGLRPEALDRKEARTYVFMDSLMGSVNADKFPAFCGQAGGGKAAYRAGGHKPERLYTYNLYEGYRLGLGLQTNDRISKHFSIGGWGAYGTNDFAWKYGGFAEIYLDPYRESMIRSGSGARCA
jgi:hypothetical protein